MPDAAPNLDASEYERLVRDALASLYDQAALGRHPFTGWLPRPSGEHQTRVQVLRNLLVDAIEQLHPLGREPQPGSSEWRPYLLLRTRYIDGAGQRDLQELLGLSERQLRRDQARAIQAVGAQLWDSLMPGQPPPLARTPAQAESVERFGEELESGSYTISPSTQDLAELLDGVATTLERRVSAQGTTLEVRVSRPGPQVLADRVVLRQVLLSLLSYVLSVPSPGPIVIGVERRAVGVDLHVDFAAGQGGREGAVVTDKGPEQAQFWAGKLGAALTLARHPVSEDVARLTLSLPVPEQPVILVVDDQETALRMFQRYLARTALRPVGIQNGAEAVEAARRLQPRAIMLDIMMPHVDGWEILQGLQADPATQSIPVIVCSVWEEPELASSLGAAGFLKKPITQKDLLAALQSLRLLESEEELQ